MKDSDSASVIHSWMMHGACAGSPIWMRTEFSFHLGGETYISFSFKAEEHFKNVGGWVVVVVGQVRVIECHLGVVQGRIVGGVVVDETH